MCFTPLHVVPELESESGNANRLFNRLIDWLDKRIPLMLTTQVPMGRRSVEQLLLRRPEFPAALWANSKAPLAFARKLAGVVKDEFEWPNNYFVPADPVRLVALPRFAEEFPTEMLRLAIQEQLGVQIDATRIRDLWMNSSLEGLAEIVYDLAEKHER